MKLIFKKFMSLLSILLIILLKPLSVVASSVSNTDLNIDFSISQLNDTIAQGGQIEIIEIEILKALAVYGKSTSSKKEEILKTIKKICNDTIEQNTKSVFDDYDWFKVNSPIFAFSTDTTQGNDFNEQINSSILETEAEIMNLSGNEQDIFLISIYNKVKVIETIVEKASNDITESDKINIYFTAMTFAIDVSNLMQEVSLSYSMPDDLKENVFKMWKKVNEIDNSFIQKYKLLKSKGATSKLGTTSKYNTIETTISAWDSNSSIGMFVQKAKGGYYMTTELLQGQALSSLYIPFNTNIYEKEYVDLTDSESFKKFDSKYGNLIKAVKIADYDKPVTQFYNTGNVSKFRTATLSDLMNTDREIFLVADQEYYEANKLDKIISDDNDLYISKFNLNDTSDDTENSKVTLNSTSTDEILPSIKKTKFKTVEEARQAINISKSNFKNIDEKYNGAESNIRDSEPIFSTDNEVQEKTDEINEYINKVNKIIAFVDKIENSNDLAKSSDKELFIYPKDYKQKYIYALSEINSKQATNESLIKAAKELDSATSRLKIAYNFYMIILPDLNNEALSENVYINKAYNSYQNGDLISDEYNKAKSVYDNWKSTEAEDKISKNSLFGNIFSKTVYAKSYNDNFAKAEKETNQDNKQNSDKSNQSSTYNLKEASLASSKDDKILYESTKVSMPTIDNENDIIKVSAQSMDSFFNWWIENEFQLRLSSEQQSIVMTSKALDNILNQNVIGSMTDFKAPVSNWLGVCAQRDIYSDARLTELISTNENKPIFMSANSSSIPMSADVYYNYMFLENIKDTMPVRYTTSLDMSSPLFVDIYGNIITESGVVIVPFAANSTLNKKYNLLTQSFLLNYGQNLFLEKDKDGFISIDGHIIDLENTSLLSTNQYPIFESEGIKDNLNILTLDTSSNRYILNSIALKTNYGTLDISKLNSSNKYTQRLLYNCSLALYLSESSQENFNSLESPIRQNIYISCILFPVLRGSSINKIDYNTENIVVDDSFNISLLEKGLQLEQLIDSMSIKFNNTILSMPNIQFLPGIEYIVFLLYRIVLIIFVIYLALQIYILAVSSKLNIYSIFKIFLSFIMIFVIILWMPFLFDFSYYWSNKQLLQNESIMLAMLNEEKNKNNIELGVVEAKSPDIKTKLYLKVKKIKVNWYEYLLDIIYSQDINSMSDIYEKYFLKDLEADGKFYELKGNELFLDLSNLFISSEVYTDFSTHQMKQIVNGEQPISFRLPYYAILDYLIYQINSYNNNLNSYTYNKFIYGDGRYRSSGLISRYFNSASFNLYRNDILYNRDIIPDNINIDSLTLAIYDRTGIFQFYNYVSLDNRNIFNDKNLFKNSQWYVDNMDFETLEKIADTLDKKAIQWVENNKSMLGRTSDENFLKALALYLSLEYNKLCNVQGPKHIEIHGISNEDLIRVSMAKRENIITGSPYSFSKFVLDTAGTMGIYQVAYLIIILFISSFLKPIITLFSCISLIISVFVYKLIMNKKTDNIKGFAKYCVIICILNVLYAICIKVGIYMPSIGVQTNLCLFYLIAIHMLYIYFYLWIGKVVILNWKDYGNSTFNSAIELKTLNVDRMINNSKIDNKEEPIKSNGVEYLDKLEQIEKKRKLYKKRNKIN